MARIMKDRRATDASQSSANYGRPLRGLGSIGRFADPGFASAFALRASADQSRHSGLVSAARSAGLIRAEKNRLGLVGRSAGLIRADSAISQKFGRCMHLVRSGGCRGDKSRWIVGALALCAALVSGCAHQHYHADGWNAEDVEGVMSSFEADAIAIDPTPPGEFAGAGAIRAWVTADFGELDEIRIALRDLRSTTSGAVACVIARYTFSAVKGGEAILAEGNLSMVWRLDEEGYKMALFHASRLPEPPPREESNRWE